MILFKKAGELHKWLEHQREKGKTIGFVPTMGALHQGHISLVKSSLNSEHLTVCSIFVNPTQFNDPTDFKKYPVTIEKDLLMLEENGCDVLFLPSVDEIYPEGMQQQPYYDLGTIETLLEGAFRPRHFQGVCMVVDRLLKIVAPDSIFLGQKDYQQCMVIAKLIQITGMGNQVKIRVCPTLREPDGLAMSSRNMRLTKIERQKAAVLYKTLLLLKEKLQPGNQAHMLKDAMRLLESEGFRPDYLALADAQTLAPVTNWDGKQKIVALVAAYLNEIRLIDNMPMN